MQAIYPRQIFVRLTAAIFLMVALGACNSKLKLVTGASTITGAGIGDGVDVPSDPSLKLAATFEGTVWFDDTTWKAVKVKSPGAERIASGVRVEILRFDELEGKVELLSAGTTDEQGEYRTQVKDLGPDDVASVVAYKDGKSIGQTMVPLSKYFEGLSLKEQPVIRANINQFETVASIILIRKNIPLRNVSPSLMKKIVALVADAVGRLGIDPSGLTSSEVAAKLLDSKEFTDDLWDVLGKKFDEERSADLTETWDFAHGRQPLSDIFPEADDLVAGALKLGAPELTSPLTLSPAILQGGQLVFHGEGVQAPVESITIGFRPLTSSVASRTSCYNPEQDAFLPLCPAPLSFSVNEDGSWSAEFVTSDFEDGKTYTVTLTAVTSSGQVVVEKTFTFTWDSKAPAAAFSIGLGNPGYTGQTATALFLNDATDVAEYRAQNGADCASAPWQPYPADGTIPFTLTGGDGSRTACLQTRDALWNESPVATDTIILDGSLPNIALSVPASLAPNSFGGPITLLTGTSFDGVSGVTSVAVSILDQSSGKCLNAARTAFSVACPTWISVSGTTSWELSVLDSLFTSGTTYRIQARARDAASNVSSPLAEQDFVWTDGPVFMSIDLVNDAANAYINAAEHASSADLVGNLVASSYTSVAYKLVGAATTCNVLLVYGATVPTSDSADFGADGSYKVCLALADADGNISYAASQPFSFDTDPPSVNAGADVTGNSARTLTPTVTGATTYSWTDTGATGHITFSNPNNAGPIVTSDQDGSYILRLTVTDAAGNSAFDELTFGWDTTGPTFSSIDLVGDVADGYLNASERAGTLDLVGNLASGVDTATSGYKLVPSTTTCNSALTYGAVPKNNAAEFGADGTYKVCIDLADSYGNHTYAASATFTLDTQAPTVNVGSDISANATVTLNPTVTGASSYAWTKQSGSGNVTFSAATASSTDATADADDVYVIRLTATDAAGNTQFDELTLTWNTTGPVFTSIDLVNDASDGYINAVENSATNDLVGNLQASGQTGATYKLVTNATTCNGSLTYGTLPKSNAVEFTTDGSYKVCVDLVDGLGNHTYGASSAFTLDTQAPTAVNAGSDMTTNASAGLSGTATGATAYQWSQVSGSGTLTFSAATASATNVTADADDTYVISFDAVDAAGNVASDILQLVWDTTAPSFTSLDLINDSANGYVNAAERTNNTALAGNLVATGQTSANYALTTAATTCDGSLTYGAVPTSDSAAFGADGNYKICVDLADDAGNHQFGATANFALDTQAPSVDAGSDVFVASTYTLSPTVTGATSTTWAQSAGGGTLTFADTSSLTSTVSADTDGAYTIQLTAVDAAGNSSSDTMQFTWNTSGPSFTSIDLINDATDGYINAAESANTTAIVGNLSASGQTGVSYAVVASATICDGSVTYSAGVPTSDDAGFGADGNYKVCVDLIDGASNHTYGASATIVLDTVLPTVNMGSSVTVNGATTLNPAVSGASSYAWSQVGGSGIVTFTAATAASTDASADTDDVYTLRLTVSDAAGNTAFDDLSFTWDTTGPTFTSIDLVNDAADTYINQSEQANGLAVVGNLTGTGIASASYEVAVDGTTCDDSLLYAGTAPLSSDGGFGADGDYIVCIDMVDAVGNHSYAASATITLDTQAPSVSVGSDLTVNATATLSPTVSGATSYLWSKQAGAGTITFTAPTAQSTDVSASADGSYTLRLTATDAAGNAAFDELDLTWDTTAPNFVTTVSLINDASDGYINAAEKTNTTAIVGSPSADEAATVTYKLVTDATVCDGSLTYGAAPNSNASELSADGDYKVCVDLVDAAGNHRYGSSATFTLDTTAPSVSVGADVTTSATASLAPTVSGATAYAWTQEAGSGVITFTAPTAASTDVSADTDDVYTLRLTATDAAGNTFFDELQLTWDTVAPTFTSIDLINDAADGYVNATEHGNSTAIVGNLVSSGEQSVSYKLVTSATTCNGALTYGAIPLSSSADFGSDGSYKVCIDLVDAAGNHAYGESGNIDLDTQAPSVDAGANASDNAPYTLAPTVSGALSVAWSQTAGPGTLTFSDATLETSTVSADADGVYTVQLTATDAAGNSASDTMQFTWSTAGPSFTSIDLINDAADGYINAAESANTTAIVGNLVGSNYTTATSVLVTSATVCDGSLTYSGSVPRSNDAGFGSDGSYKVCVDLVDGVGNHAYGESSVIALDKTLPSLTLPSSFSSRVASTITPTVSGASTYAWVQSSGSGTVTFSAQTSAITQASADADDSYTLTLTVADAAGNSVSDTIVMTWDTTAPVVTSVDLAAVASDGYVNASEHGAHTAMVTGVTATGNDAVGYKLVAVATVCDGSLTYGGIPYTDSTDFGSDGTYKICADVYDNTGNHSYDESTAFDLDTSLPTVNAGGNVLTNAQVSQNATVSGAATYQWTKQAGSGTITFGSATAEDTTISASADGVYTIRLTATDAAGNSAFAEISFEWDTTAPTFTSIDLVNDAADGYINAAERSSTSVLVSNLSASGYASVGYKLVTNATPCGNALTYNALAPQGDAAEFGSDGSYKICVQLVDGAGNETYSSSSSIALDTTVPSVTSITASNTNGAYTVGTNINLSLTFNESVVVDLTGTDPTLTLNTTPTESAEYTSGSGGSVLAFTYSVQAGDTAAELDAAAGTGQLVLNGSTILDAAGNSTSLDVPVGAVAGSLATNKTIEIDTTPPSAFSIDNPSWPLKTATPTISWTDPGDADAYDLKIVASANCGAAAIAGQSYADITTNSQVLSSLASGYYWACVTAKDDAGNTTAASNQPKVFTITLPDSWIYVPNTLTNTPIARGNGDHLYLGSTGPYAQKHVFWGGFVSGLTNTNTGGIFDAVNYTWTPMTTTGAHTAVFDDAHVWTGDTGNPATSYKIIFWGGGNGSGASQATGKIYDIATDTWSAVQTTGAPTKRDSFPYAWTGNTGVAGTSYKLLMWGGESCTIFSCSYPNDGKMYDIATNAWTSISSTNAPAGRYLRITMWDDAGKRLFVWGGYGSSDTPINTGAYYDLASDTWTTITNTGAPARRDHFAGVFTGNTGDPATENRMIIWGGRNDSGSGGKWTDISGGGVYDVATDSWTPISTTGEPPLRGTLDYIWTGTHMMIWNGNIKTNGTNGGNRTDAYLYDPKTNTWTQTGTTGTVPTVGRYSDLRRDWLGSDDMVFSFFGYDAANTPLNDGWIYILP